MQGCLWSLALLFVAALTLGWLPGASLAVAAVPLAFLFGHWMGWRGAVETIEAAGHAKVEKDADDLRKRWRWWK